MFLQQAEAEAVRSKHNGRALELHELSIRYAYISKRLSQYFRMITGTGGRCRCADLGSLGRKLSP